MGHWHVYSSFWGLHPGQIDCPFQHAHLVDSAVWSEVFPLRNGLFDTPISAGVFDTLRLNQRHPILDSLHEVLIQNRASRLLRDSRGGHEHGGLLSR